MFSSTKLLHLFAAALSMYTLHAAPKTASKKAPTEAETKIEGDAEGEGAEGAEVKEKVSRSKFGDDQIITLLVDYNPKRPNTAAHKSFECYEDGMTVKAFREAGGLAISLGWDTEHGFIKIGDTFDEDAEKKTKPVKEVKAPVEKVPADSKAAATAVAGKPSKVAGKK